MQFKLSDLAKKIAPYLIFLALTALLIRYGKEIAVKDNPWRVGDWLINYSAGLTRRGLTGTLFFWLNEQGFPLKWTLFSFQASLYLTTYLIAFKIYQATDKNSTWLLLLLSPIFILFPYYDYGGSFRKEIIPFAAFSFLCLAYVARRHWLPSLVAACALFALGCFSHEANALSLPFFLYMVWRGFQDELSNRAQSIFFAILLTFVSASGLAFAAIFKGSHDISAAVCQSLLEKGMNEKVCTGAIKWLARDSDHAFKLVLKNLPQNIELYLPIVLIAFTPLALIKRWPTDSKIAFAFGFLALTPLYAIAIDWGRWLHIFAFYVFFITLAEAARGKLESRVRGIPAMVLIAYLATWYVPHCYETAPPIREGVREAFEQLAALLTPML